jgi:Fe-S cluster biogenesis protein NfuA
LHQKIIQKKTCFLRHEFILECFLCRDNNLEEFVMTESVQSRVEKAIAKIRPALQADGGNIELVGIEGTIVKVRLVGACAGCPMAAMTLQQGVERTVKSMVPEITAVQNVPAEGCGCEEEEHEHTHSHEGKSHSHGHKHPHH